MLEIISKLQTMRKEAGFEVMDRIYAYADGNDKIARILEDNAETVKEKVLAENIILGDVDGYVKEWNINGETVTLAVEKACIVWNNRPIPIFSAVEMVVFIQAGRIT